MPIEYIKFITRRMIKATPSARFVFGDNAARTGLGGQAKEMRGELNSIGVATKWRPEMNEKDFFVDWNPACRTVMMLDLGRVSDALKQNLTVYAPIDGLGTGYSQLPARAPKLYAELCAFFEKNSPQGCPWPN